MTSKYAPVIDATGISAPDFATNLANLQADYQSIFGSDVYLGNDSQDGQFVAILAQAITDCGAAAIAVYNAFSPNFAQGNGLSSVVKINGMTRMTFGYSSAYLTVVGVANTTITNGQAKDTNGNLWALPASVTIPSSGSVIVLASCMTVGAISAGASTITSINTPVYGWQSVTNAAAATLGAAVETDAALRVRQSQSVALPSVTIFDGIVAALEALSGVTRVRGYENNTGSVDANGIAANTLAFVVEGGTASAIQAAIAQRIPPGIPTAGSISAIVTSANGSTRTINYSAPTESSISVALTLAAGTGWSSSIEPVIAQAIADYINALKIGQSVSYTELFVPAYAALAQYPGTYTISAMTIKKGSGSSVSTDIAIAYNEVANCAVGNISFSGV